ncbi:hypothetical protein [Kitasatospora sp. NPDC091207]|uniref:hypothetical protein n=1 Tax=Kitasatospora sp. NPDC091207 TaxID=3364083 RepID=UPI00382B4DFA
MTADMTADMTAGTGPEPLGLCVVADVARETTHGDGGPEIRTGLRHFAPGAEVWLAPPRWDGGSPDVPVVGRHRGNSRRRTAMVMPRRFPENFRVQAVHSPAAPNALGGGPLWTAEHAERYVDFRGAPRPATQLEVEGQDWPRYVQAVTDPPPMEPESGGATYYSAHFNANRAHYSPLPPPVEAPAPPAGPAGA